MPPVPVFPPFYVGVVVFGCLAVYVGLKVRRAHHEGVEPPGHRKLVALFVALVVVTGAFVALTAVEAVTASTWVYNYYLEVDTADATTGSIVLPVPADTGLLAGLRANSSAMNWSYVSTTHGPGLYVAFRGPGSLDAAVRLFAPFGSHPDPRLAPQPGNQTTWQVWIEYAGSDAVNVNFQYGDGYVINGAAVYIGPLSPGWNAYEMIPAP